MFSYDDNLNITGTGWRTGGNDGIPAYEESIHWLYEPGALTPLARSEKGQLHYVVSDHLARIPFTPAYFPNAF
ncbi:hypothetical protein [Rahnella sikkimica]|uniref:Uncharacterized protein n=1 Tax=Rahnella sikkimica TaxID=1805933 RepID=A0A2L1ULD0_9GAMM|nr:hypothetical protein [Rahnella sikkimica]AVF33732.1 hypothetical protein BV494_01790 [Rahnella sikkimica]